MRILRLSVVLAAAALCGGCFQSDALVKVNADGSGTIEHRTLMTAPALAQLRQLSGLFGGNAAKPVDPFSEEQARELAGTMGDGVTLVSSTPLKTAAAEGRANVYAFRDITKLRLSEVPSTPGNTSVRANGAGVGGNQGGAVTFDLTKAPGGNVVLTLHNPNDLVDRFRSSTGSSGASTASADQMAMLQQAMAGLRLAVRVEPAGRLVRTSSPYVDGQIVTLFDLNLDELLKDDATLTRLMSARTTEDLTALLKNAPGFKVNLEREITIEFAPAR